MANPDTPKTRGRGRILTAVGLALSLSGGLPLALANEAPRLASDSAVSTAGFFQLTWSGPEAAEYELVEAGSADFAPATVRYRGPDLATVVSGKPDGDYHYRIRAWVDGTPSAWSEDVQVSVQHHPLARALTVLALGALVFAAILVVILRGEARTR